VSNLLVTGSTGFVGRNCLLQAVSRYDLIYASVRSEKKLREQLTSEGLSNEKIHPLPSDPAAWPKLHLDHAILSAGVLFARTREEYFETNVSWIVNILRALPPNCRTVILSSQSAGGPTPSQCDARSETTPDAPITWYGESKLAMEKTVRASFSDRSITILRPPMVLGARDLATLPLFRMGKGLVRLKPGLQTKTYSYIAVDDLVSAIFAALNSSKVSATSLYVASPTTISDRDLIASAASNSSGFTLAIPQTFVRLLSAIVDAVPALRAQAPSLTRDRAKEIWSSRWVVDGAQFAHLYKWRATQSLSDAMNAARDFYIRAGLL
jgi:nucleoside-diphosphate-sugar epimerase